MILTPIAPHALDLVLAAFERALDGAPFETAVFRRIADSRAAEGGPVELWHADAVALTECFGMQPLAEAPQQAFSWDGARVRTKSEPAVLVHEVAHYQIASPSRRFLPDFGLGAGPETGEIAIADGARAADDATRETEEAMASLLGILWEVELGQPAILAFQEQNWLEGAGRAGTADFFRATLHRLAALGLIDEDGRPTYAVRIAPEP
ncbi:hypothetical protein GCM10011611_19660 [Aliidongia dinghuensis]|uniref:Elongation factor P hydroxylase n=1 Tax=Aliidongia dinghuensis TaxID=1867774 RepID=A0A8J3E4F2_9PROT|nr:hypothetical protein [Aliidongia dinghuensis]GGF13994.1 hypothetical protein GCM10011611_19660 [Aliidongia dinghuensis]